MVRLGVFMCVCVSVDSCVKSDLCVSVTVCAYRNQMKAARMSCAPPSEMNPSLSRTHIKIQNTCDCRPVKQTWLHKISVESFMPRSVLPVT